MIHGFLVTLHLIVGIILILVVLLQTGKGADLAGAFGGGGSQTAFGSRGAATLLSKMTTGAAVLFMVTSFSLAVLSARGRTSVLDQTTAPTSVPPPGNTSANQEPAADVTPADGAGATTPESPAAGSNEEENPADAGDDAAASSDN
ncbi:MAG: preprotein translocase subunit SecG [Acidobacteriota bacterium]